MFPVIFGENPLTGARFCGFLPPQSGETKCPEGIIQSSSREPFNLP